jgi:hypothetical protein
LKRCRVLFLLAVFTLAEPLVFGLPRHKSHGIGSGFSDQGTFVLSVGGQSIGRENFQIERVHAGYEARAQIELQVQRNGKTMHFRTSPDLVLNSNLDPLTYTWSQRGSENSHLRIDLRQSPATVRYHTVKGRNDDRTIQLPRDVIILDDNVIYQYEIAVLRYFMTAGGRQAFHAFIPQEALPGMITIEDQGQAQPTQGKQLALRHLLLITDQAHIGLWVDQDHRIQRLAIPAAQFEAVRSE